MGLDMYLTGSLYLSKYDKDSEKLRKAISKKFNNGFQVEKVIFDIGYWRKANAIHGWLVNKLANGKDDCNPIYVTRDDLRTLKALCEQVIADILPLFKARDVELPFTNPWLDDNLPLVGGFFFGEYYNYTDWYFEYVQETIDIIDKALLVDEDIEFYYQASW